LGIRSSIFKKGKLSNLGIFLSGLYDNSIGIESELVNLNNESEIELFIDNEEVDIVSSIKEESYKRTDVEEYQLFFISIIFYIRCGSIPLQTSPPNFAQLQIALYNFALYHRH
jgi:hypothetical protein